MNAVSQPRRIDLGQPGHDGVALAEDLRRLRAAHVHLAQPLAQVRRENGLRPSLVIPGERAA